MKLFMHGATAVNRGCPMTRSRDRPAALLSKLLYRCTAPPSSMPMTPKASASSSTSEQRSSSLCDATSEKETARTVLMSTFHIDRGGSDAIGAGRADLSPQAETPSGSLKSRETSFTQRGGTTRAAGTRGVGWKLPLASVPGWLLPAPSLLVGQTLEAGTDDPRWPRLIVPVCAMRLSVSVGCACTPGRTGQLAEQAERSGPAAPPRQTFHADPPWSREGRVARRAGVLAW